MIAFLVPSDSLLPLCIVKPKSSKQCLGHRVKEFWRSLDFIHFFYLFRMLLEKEVTFFAQLCMRPYLLTFKSKLPPLY